MLNFKLPKSIGNADEINEKGALLSNFIMIKYEDIFDYYSDEPISVSIKLSENSEALILGRVLQIRIWNKEKKSYAWSIYSDDRMDLNNLLIRKVVWDMDIDMQYAKQHIKEDRAQILKSWPTMNNINKYIGRSHSLSIAKIIRELDLIIEKGISLNKSQAPKWAHREMEFLRLSDWGQVHLLWAPVMENKELETKINNLISVMDMAIEDDISKVFSMKMNFYMLPEIFKENYMDIT